jgi:predicted Holliday junction resolvase-like endonuclease
MSLLNADSDRTTHTDHTEQSESPKGSKGKGIFLGIIIAVLAVGNVYLISRVERLQSETASLQSTLQQQIGGVQERESLYAGQARRELENLRQQIEEARKEAAGRAQREARRHADQVAQNLTQQQQHQQEELMSGIHDARSVADQANTEVQVVRNDLLGMKADVEDTNAHLYETASLLDQTTDDLGEISGQVGDNRSQIASLQRMTERDRVRFQLTRSKEMQRVADIQLRLRDTDVKHNKFTLEILADDKKFVKKDRQVAEPVMFYMGDTAQPYELVITKIEKDGVSGYLARPKVQMASR